MDQGRAALRARTTTRVVAAWLLALLLGPALADPEPAVDRDAPPAEVVQVADLPRAELPMPESTPWLGVVVTRTRGGVRVLRTDAGGPAELGGIRAGDVIRRLDDHRIQAPHDLTRHLSRRLPGQEVRLLVQRYEDRLELSAELGAVPSSRAIFRRPVYRLAVVPLAFGEAAAEPAEDTDTAADALRRLLFELTGAAEPGASVADYVLAQSYGRLHLEGRVFPPVRLPDERETYAERRMGAGPQSAFQVALDALAEREGEETLTGFDGFAFLYPGPAETRPGRALWPHRSTARLGRRHVPYYVHVLGAADDGGIGVHCHEFGHLIGLPDLYGQGHRTGVGDFCLMALGHRGGGESGERLPFQLSAWSRLRLGWVQATVLDPRVTRRVRLAPVDRDPTQVVVVPLDRESSEYLLLEVRVPRGFDRQLPSHGLLVWHVGGEGTPGQGVYRSHVDLLEAHGVDVFDASLRRTDHVAFPTARARHLTPDTLPGLPPQGPRHLPVFLTDIERCADGSVEFTLGVRDRVQQAAPKPIDAIVLDDQGFTREVDPITRHTVRFYLGPPETAPAGLVPATGVPITSESERR